MKNVTHLVELEWEKLEKIKNSFIDNPKGFNNFECQTNEYFEKVKQNFMANVLNAINQNICESSERKAEWYINTHDNKDYLSIVGKISFTKTLFTHKETGESRYLIDDVLDIDSYERISDNAKAKILKEAEQTSYKKAGRAVSTTDSVSKETVKDIIHSLEFPDKTYEDVKTKRRVPVLYIEADEDHEKLQFNNKRGDLQTGKSGRKDNGIISKLVYVHEGVRPESDNSKRNQLINPHYFASTCGDIDNEDFWNNVDNYIQATYDTQNIPYIFLMADGGRWIKTALKCIPRLIYVLDEFHLNTHINKISRKFWDSASDVGKTLRELIEDNNYTGFDKTIQKLCMSLDDKDKEKVMEDVKYIASNWGACYLRLKLKGGICGCSTEAHISHVLARRMSSRPLAWSRLGSDKMVQLIAYIKNHESLHELIAYQSFLKHQKDKNYKKNQERAKKYYVADKLKAQTPLTSRETKQKYVEVFSVTTLPAQTQRNWLDKVIDY